MQTYLDCYPCFIRQAIEASRMAGASPAEVKAVVIQSMEILKQQSVDATPPALGSQVHQVVREITGNPDPYRDVKSAATSKALGLMPKLRSLLFNSEDRLETAVRMSIAGNIMDFGPNPKYDLWEVVERILKQEFAINDLSLLKQQIEKAESILFLGDNAGETVFDRLLIETLEVPVTYVVRGGPVINDATVEDAMAVGMDSVAEVIDNGAQIPGTILSECSPAFQSKFRSAELILAKGMGNYETLSEVNAPIFFLLQVKCPVIAKDVGVEVGSTIVKKSKGFSESVLQVFG